MLDVCHVHSVEFRLIRVVTYVRGLMATDDKFEILSNGELTVTGRLVDASNATLYATATIAAVWQSGQKCHHPAWQQ